MNQSGWVSFIGKPHCHGERSYFIRVCISLHCLNNWINLSNLLAKSSCDNYFAQALNSCLIPLKLSSKLPIIALELDPSSLVRCLNRWRDSFDKFHRTFHATLSVFPNRRRRLSIPIKDDKCEWLLGRQKATEAKNDKRTGRRTKQRCDFVAGRGNEGAAKEFRVRTSPRFKRTESHAVRRSDGTEKLKRRKVQRKRNLILFKG